MGMGQEIMDDLMLQEHLHEIHMEDLANSECWETADKRTIRIVDMETSHLQNTIRWLGKNDLYPYSDSFIKLMQEELKKRI